MKLLAIDPGFERIGIAVIEKTLKGKEVLLYSDCFKTSPKIPFVERLNLIGGEVARVIKEWDPSAFAIEKLYFATNKTTAMGVAEARGVLCYEAARAGLHFFEYTPIQIKVATTGYGKATKDQVLSMTAKLISLPENKKMIDDEVDAIAIGLTCFAYENFKL